MTTAEVLPAETTDTEVAVQPAQSAEPQCAVCQHDLARHDAVGLRYCQASEARSLTRGCICR
jgi:hypothetical protein